MENMRGRGRGRRGRGRGRGSNRRKKSIDLKEDIVPEEVDDDVEPSSTAVIETQNTMQLVPPIDMEADISQLEAPTFTTLSRGPPEPMLRLRWNHPVNLLGEKVLNPLIHCCDTCLRPVLIYGRMIPCKHVFCLACAQRDSKACPRCNDKVVRVERTGLGTVFMCTHGGTRYGNTGCRRTYLSQRDLQAHINHRHVQAPPVGVLNPISVQCSKVAVKNEPRLTAPTGTSPFYEAGKVKMFEEVEPITYASPRPAEAPPTAPPTVRPPAPRASNLITVPIQEPPPDPYFAGYNAPPPIAPPIAPLPHPPPHVPPHVPPPIAPLAHAPPLGSLPPHQPYYPPYDYPPPTDTSVPPPNQWPANPPFYG